MADPSYHVGSLAPKLSLACCLSPCYRNAAFFVKPGAARVHLFSYVCPPFPHRGNILSSCFRPTKQRQKSKAMSSLDYKEDARDLHAFKELRFFLSHSVPLEIRCSVSRLELPLVADYLLGAGSDSDTYGNSRGADYDNNQQGQQQKQQQHEQGLRALEGGKGRGGDDANVGMAMERIVRRIVAEPELVASCQLFSDGQPMHKVAVR